MFKHGGEAAASGRLSPGACDGREGGGSGSEVACRFGA